MQHLLFDQQTATTTTLTCQGETLTIRTEAKGKQRSTSKTFDDKPEAIKQFLKKEWELLKKGAIMREPNAEPGTALLHVFIGMGYTGCLSFEATPHGIYVYRPGGNGKEMGTQDDLLCLNHDGTVASVLTLPGLLPWEIRYDPQNDELLIDLDHYIYTYDIAAASFTRHTNELNLPASFATIGGSTKAYGTHPYYYVTKGQNSQPQQLALDAEIVRGSVPLAAGLSPDGEVLALHTREGQVQLISTSDHSVLQVLQAGFGKVEQLLWTNDSQQLIVHDHYSSSTPLYFFDRNTGNELRYEGLKLPSYTQYANDVCVNASNTLLVCLQRTNAFVFDLANKKFLYEFKVHHVVKTANIKFIDDRTLGVRTDYACFSIYQL